jgi:S-adenosylmethionine:tRNA ribosyltransferase-isomerase
MLVDLFDFDLPQERIALRPAEPRDSARMLVVRPGEAEEIVDDFIGGLPGRLAPGDALVVNDARVVPARLIGMRRRGDAVAQIEATLHKRAGQARWQAFVRPAKKLKVGEKIRFGAMEESAACALAFLDAEVAEKNEDGEVLLVFEFAGAALDEAIERVGRMPLPPYIASRRPEDARDRVDYQTLFAATPGAVAAPTAGLHFTPALVSALEARGLALHRVTLHVGAGTFLPVKAQDTTDHKMHAEIAEIDEGTACALNEVRARGGRIVSVGTTSLRVLESAADESGVLRAFHGDTRLFVTPGYRFRAIDALLTNFHLPRSTLFMLVAAFSGLETMRRAYSHAVAAGYRFYSYGDACLLFRARES